MVILGFCRIDSHLFLIYDILPAWFPFLPSWQFDLTFVEFLELEVGPEAKNFLSKIEGPIAVVIIAGEYRIGKSFFLNRVLLK